MNRIEPTRSNNAVAIDEISTRRAVFVHYLQVIVVGHRERDAVAIYGCPSPGFAALHVNGQQFRVEFPDFVVGLVQLDQLMCAGRSPVRTRKNQHHRLLVCELRERKLPALHIGDGEVRRGSSDFGKTLKRFLALGLGKFAR